MNVETDSIKNFRTILVRGLPRQGKTRWAVFNLSQAASGIYLTHRHEIINHAIKIFSELVNDRTCIWIEGKHRSCKTGKLNCNNCRMKPDEHRDDHISYFELETIVEQLLDKYKILTKDRILEAEPPEIVEKYGGLCPYYCMRIAVSKARYVFTVPQLASEIPFKELLVIDEDPTVDHFYPQSACICEYTHNNKERNVRILIPNRVKNLAEVKHIHYAKDIRRAAEFLLQIESILQKFKDAQITQKELVNELESLDFPEFDNPAAVIRKLEELLPADEVKTFFEPVLFPAKQRFFWESNINGSRVKLWMVANEEEIYRPVPPTYRRIIIGATRAALFAKQVFGDYEEVKVSPSLPFLNNFAIITVEMLTEDEDGNKRVSKEKTREVLEKVITRFYRKGVPTFVVTGSEEQQERCVARLRDRRILVYPVKKESLEQVKRVWLSGAATVVYANSSISRGIDLNFYDVGVIYNIDFSTPYWSAMAEYYKNVVTPGSEREEVGAIAQKYEEIREKIISDELFNLLLRIAPVKGDGEDEAKIVFLPAYYLQRILTVAGELGYLKTFKERLIDKWSNDEEVIEKIPEILWALLKRVEVKAVDGDTTKVVENQDSTSSISRFKTFILQPDEKIYQVVREDKLMEYLPQLIESNKNKALLDMAIYEKIRNNLSSYFGSARRLSSGVLKSKIKKKAGISEEYQIKLIIKQLVLDGYLRRRKMGRKVYYELIKRGDE